MDNSMKKIISNLPDTRNEKSFYTLLIHGDNQGFDTQDRYIALDVVESVSVNLTTNITSYPLVNGDVISDHKYDEPASVSLRGVFSLNGRFNDSFSSLDNKSDRLKNIETYFENVRKYGKLITLLSGNLNEDRFNRRDNLVLKNIDWTEKLNTITFNFSLQQVYLFDFNESELQISEDEEDPYLPTIKEFGEVDFIENIIGDDGLVDAVVNVLNENGLIFNNFGDMFVSTVTFSLLDWGVAALIVHALTTAHIIKATVAAGILNALGVTLSIGTAVPVVKWVVIGLAIVAGIAYAILNIIKLHKKNSLIREFRVYDNQVDNEKEAQRFINLLRQVESSWRQIISDTNTKFYTAPSNDNKQSMVLSIDDIQYTFEFERTNEGFWSLRVSDQRGNTINTNSTTKLIGGTNLFDMTSGDALFEGQSGTKVYVLNSSLTLNLYDKDVIEARLVDEFKKDNISYLNLSEDEISKAYDEEGNITQDFKDLMYTKFFNNGIYKDLTKYVFVVSPLNMGELKQKLVKGIENCLYRQ